MIIPIVCVIWAQRTAGQKLNVELLELFVDTKSIT